MDSREASLGKGGRKSGIWGGGCQFVVRGRFRSGLEGLDIGEGGSAGLDGGRLPRGTSMLSSIIASGMDSSS